MPDRDPATPAPSLAGALMRGLRAPPAGTVATRRSGIALALLILAGPLLTLAGARLLAMRAEDDAARLRDRLAPARSAFQAQENARAMLGDVAARPTLGATLEALAGVLPPGASLTRAERDARGRLALEILTNDPDALRAALRRSDRFAALRDVAERQGDSGMLVTLREGE